MFISTGVTTDEYAKRSSLRVVKMCYVVIYRSSCYKTIVCLVKTIITNDGYLDDCDISQHLICCDLKHNSF